MSIIDIEQELLRSLGEDLRKSIDYDLLCELLIPEGYTRIKITYGGGRKWVEVIEWAANNFTGTHREHNGVWLIEKPKDATMFMLRWE